MAEGKNSFVLYTDLLHTVEKLPDDQAGKLFKIILEYVNDKDPEIEDLLLQVVFEPIKQQMKRDLKKWEKYIEKQRENGKKGGRPPKTQETQGEPKKPKPFSENPTEPKKADNVNVSVTVSDNVTDNAKRDISERKRSFAQKVINHFDKEFPLDDLKEFCDYWTEHGENDRKMKFEKVESFDWNLRVRNWMKRRDKFKTNKPQSFQDELEQRIDVMKQTQALLNFDENGNLID